MKNTLIILFSLCILGCVDDKPDIEMTIKGNIHIKGISLGSAYGATDDMLQKFKNEIENYKGNDTKDDDIYNYFKLLIKLDILDKPMFLLKTKENKSITVFTTEVEYKKLSPYLETLDRKSEVIEVEFVGREIGLELGEGLFFADKLIVNKKPGKTEYQK